MSGFVTTICGSRYLTKKDPQSAEANRGSECSHTRRPKSSRRHKNRLAREHTVATTPPVRDRGGTRIHVPTVVAPTHGDRTKRIALVLHIEDVPAAIREQIISLTTPLFLHQREHLEESGLDFLFTPELFDDEVIP